MKLTDTQPYLKFELKFNSVLRERLWRFIFPPETANVLTPGEIGDLYVSELYDIHYTSSLHVITSSFSLSLFLICLFDRMISYEGMAG